MTKSYLKKYKRCKSKEIKKDWFKGKRQRCKCKICSYIY